MLDLKCSSCSSLLDIESLIMLSRMFLLLKLMIVGSCLTA